MKSAGTARFDATTTLTTMHRDLDATRAILIELEGWPNEFRSALKALHLEGFDDSVVAEHVHQLYEAGFIEGHDVTSMDDSYQVISPTRITSSGHDFLAALRNDTVWKKLKAKAEQEGEVFRSAF